MADLPAEGGELISTGALAATKSASWRSTDTAEAVATKELDVDFPLSSSGCGIGFVERMYGEEEFGRQVSRNIGIPCMLAKRELISSGL